MSVDGLAYPSKYIVWSTHMNTHVLPEFLVCIKAPFNFNSKQQYTFFLVPMKCKEIEISMDGVSCIDQSIIQVPTSFPNTHHSKTL
ncbi:hypothetical protein Bca52824_029844 [Brassica carinata]|uniref:PARP catalytic domain-containing protein n=1 Tax=Brassica carinata TaxID=52824 RepID=A0A8X7S557_BRACI|nr:hypothetical protein Bca52824_029844 [Brassica carinata]